MSGRCGRCAAETRGKCRPAAARLVGSVPPIAASHLSCYQPSALHLSIVDTVKEKMKGPRVLAHQGRPASSTTILMPMKTTCSHRYHGVSWRLNQSTHAFAYLYCSEYMRVTGHMKDRINEFICVFHACKSRATRCQSRQHLLQMTAPICTGAPPPRVTMHTQCSPTTEYSVMHQPLVQFQGKQHSFDTHSPLGCLREACKKQE